MPQPTSTERGATEPGSTDPAPALRAVTLGLLGLYLALSLWVLWRSAVLTPYADELDWIGRWRGLQVDGDWAAYLLAPVNLHRIAWTFGLLAVDAQVLGGTNAPLILSGALGLAVIAAVLGREAARAAPAALALPAGAAAAMLALMAGNVLDASTPICVDYIHGAVFAVLSMVLAEGAGGEAAGRRRVAALTTALACAMASALGDAAGLAVWPVLAIAAARRRDWRWLGAVVLVGGAFVAAYASGQGGETQASTAGLLQGPANALKLALSYLVLPWTRLAPRFAWLGGIGVALVCGLALLRRGGPGAPRSERIACALILFSLGTAAMAAVGRAGLEDAAETPLRYAVLMTPLHVGVLMLALPFAARFARVRPIATARLAAAALALLAAQDAVMAVKVVHASDTVRTALADFRAGKRTPEMRVFVHPDLALAERVYAGLAADGLFQHELHLKPAARAR